MFSRERSCDFSRTVSQPLLRLGFDGDLAPSSPGFLQVHPGYLSKSSWLLTQDRVSPPSPSFLPFRFLYHRFAPLCPSFPPPV
ncbi:hypothetical protein A2U01_0057025, partial [Trifolium medium]|nr:hypothetical protein [Trifolium medium]